MKDMFDLKYISKELENGETCEDEDGNTYKSIYLGSIYNIMPSGKFYMPFAYSNLTICGRCNGSGEIPNPRKKTKSYHRAMKQQMILIKTLSKNCWHMPSGHMRRLDIVRKRANYYQPLIECPTCGGCGDPEAYQDELWRAQAEKELEPINAFITYDGDDIFINKYVESE